MALNELIAQGVQFKAPDLLGQYATMQNLQQGMQQNALNMMKMDEMRRATDEQNRLRSAYAGITDYNDPTILNKIGAISPKAAMDMGEYQRKVLESKSKVNKEGAEAVATALKNSRIALDGVTTPEQYLQWHLGNHSDPVLGEWLKQRGVTPESAMKRIQEAMTSPEKFQNMINESKIGAEKTLENNFSNFDTGQQIGVNVMPKYGSGAARVVPGTVMNKQATPDALMTNARGVEANATSRDRLNFEMNPEAQARVTGAKEGAKIQTKNTLDAQAALPAAMQHVNEVNNIISQMIGDATVNAKGKIVIPQGGAKPHKGFQVSVGASAQPGFQLLSGTDKADFYALKDQILSDAFLTAYKDSLKGGGAITEIEGEKGTRALLRARTSQSEPEFIKAMREFQQSNAKIAESLKVKAGGGAPAAGNTPAPTVAPKIPPGWNLHQDAKGNKAYVSPDGKNFIEVK